VVVILRDDPAGPVPFSVIRIGIAGGQVVSIVDYIKCSWILETACLTLMPAQAARSKLLRECAKNFDSRRIPARAPFVMGSVNDSEGSSRVNEDLLRKLSLRRRSLSSRTRLCRGNGQVQLQGLRESAFLAHFYASRSISSP
jgi:hypothetical protein